MKDKKQRVQVTVDGNPRFIGELEPKEVEAVLALVRALLEEEESPQCSSMDDRRWQRAWGVAV